MPDFQDNDVAVTANSGVPMTMKAAVVEAAGRVGIHEVQVPRPPKDGVLIRVSGCGVCASNVPRWEGRPWFSYPTEPGELGHEGCGEIVAVGEGADEELIGQWAVYLSNHSFAEYDTAEEGKFLIVPESFGHGYLPGEPMACAWNILERSGLRSGDVAAIVGSGYLAALLVQLMVARNIRPLVISRKPALERFFPGAMMISTNSREEALAKVAELTNHQLCPVVIESTGHQDPLDLASEITAEGGRLVIAGYHQDGLRTVNMQLWNWRGFDVINAHERATVRYMDGMRAAIREIQEGRWNPAALITHHLPLSELGAALAMAAQRPAGFLKAVVHP